MAGEKVERKWREETDALGIDELCSFTNGIRRGIAAVKNACCIQSGVCLIVMV